MRDKTLFIVQAMDNNQKDRIYALNERIDYKCQKPTLVMVLVGVTSKGERNPLPVIEERLKINHVYRIMLMELLVHWINEIFKEPDITPTRRSHILHC